MRSCRSWLIPPAVWRSRTPMGGAASTRRERSSPASFDGLGAASRRSDLAGALAAARERYRGRPVAGIVLLSDGGDTGAAVERSGGAEASAPVYAFGVGSETLAGDSE